jgi:hypothetical protein
MPYRECLLVSVHLLDVSCPLMPLWRLLAAIQVHFDDEKLVENAGALMEALLLARPPKLKGSGASNFILRMYMSSTMGPSVPVMVQSVVAARMS